MKKYNVRFSSAIVYMIPTLFCLVVAIMFFYEAITIADFRDNSATVKGILLETDLKYNEEFVYYDDRNPKDSRIEVETEYIHKNIFMGALFLVGALIVAYLNYRLIIKSISCL